MSERSWLKPAAMVLLPLWLPGVALAQVTWSGGGGNSNFSTGANWIGGVTPTSSTATILQFGGSSNLSPNVDAPFTLNQLSIDHSSGYLLGGSELTFGGVAPRITASGFTNHAITAPIGFGTDLLIGTGPFLGSLALGNVTNNGALVTDVASGTISIAGLSGSGSLTKNGLGGLSGSTNWTHGGDTTLNAGTISATITSGGRLTVTNGTFQSAVSSFGSLAGSGGLVRVNDNGFGTGSLTIGADNTSTTYSGVIDGAGRLIKTGTGTLTLTNAPQTSGGIAINAGTLQISNSTSGFFASIGTVVNNGTFVSDVGTGTLNLLGMSGTGSLVKNGLGTLTGLTDLTHGGDTTLNAGTISTVITSSGRLTVNGGLFQSARSSFGSLAGSGGLVRVNDDGFGTGSLTIGADNTSTTYSGVIEGAGRLIKTGTGTLTLTNAPQTSGGIAINTGTLQISNSTSGFFASIGTVVNNGTFVSDVGTGTLNLLGMSGTGSLVKNGLGTLTGLTDLTHGGDTTLNAGTISAVITSTGRLTVNDGLFSSARSSFGSLAGSGGRINVLDCGPACSNLTVGADNTNTTYSGVIDGAGRLIKTGTGTLTLTNAPNTSGGIAINAGTLRISNSTSGFFASIGTVVNNGTFVSDVGTGTLNLLGMSGTGSLVKNGLGTLTSFTDLTHGGDTTLNAGTISATITSGGRLTVNDGLFSSARSSFGSLAGSGGTVRVNDNGLGSGSLTVGADNTSTTYSGVIEGPGGLIKTGTGTLTLANAPQTSGGIAINAGTLQIGTGGKLLNGGVIAGSVLNNGVLAVDIDDTGFSVGITGMSGTGSLVKNGSGALTLSGANTYVGPTTVNGGRVAVNGSLMSAVSVNAGGTLGGTGTIANALTVNAGGVLAPGNSIGMLTLDSSLDQVLINGLLEIEINGPLVDTLQVNGPRGVRFGDDAAIRFILLGTPDLSRDYGFLFANLLEGFDADVDISFQGPGPGTGYIVFQGTDGLYLRFQTSAVPVPGTILLLAAGLLVLFTQRRALAR